jgi:uncharacterized protein (TIGR03435 family)
MAKARLLVAVGTVALVGSVVGALVAQTPASSAFEVASVKPGKFTGSFYNVFQPGGRFLASCTLECLIANAYGIPQAVSSQRILGGPKWLNDDWFEIVAKAATDFPRSAPTPEMFSLVRTLLADRFKLVVHTETREVPAYALVVARQDGKRGPQLRSTPQDCAAWIARGRPGAAPPALTDPPCSRQRVDRSTIAGSGMTMSQLANLLSPRVDRVVRDRTDLRGYFDLNLQWTPEPSTAGSPDAQRPTPAAIDPTGVTLVTALQEQLGLKLESIKDPVDVLIIDHVEHPTPD